MNRNENCNRVDGPRSYDWDEKRCTGQPGAKCLSGCAVYTDKRGFRINPIPEHVSDEGIRARGAILDMFYDGTKTAILVTTFANRAESNKSLDIISPCVEILLVNGSDTNGFNSVALGADSGGRLNVVTDKASAKVVTFNGKTTTLAYRYIAPVDACFVHIEYYTKGFS